MNRLLRFALPWTLALCATPTFATTVGVTADPTLNIWWDNPTDATARMLVGTVVFEVDENGGFVADAQSFTWGSGDEMDTIDFLGGDGNLDPFVNFAVGVIDSGAASIFTFTFSSPVAPALTGLVNYTLDLAGSFSNGSPNNGGSLAMAAPNTLGVLEGRFNGTTSIDGIGGPAVFPALVSSTYGPFASSGTYDCSLIGACTSMQARLSFLGSGGADAYNFTGRFEITPVPVPAAVWLLGSALGLLGVVRRRMG